MATDGVHRTMLATLFRRIVEVARAQTSLIHTLSDAKATAADDRNVPRILADAPKRYAPGGAMANDR